MGKVKVRRVVIDTNVLISAFLFGGDPGELIPLWKSGRIHPLASKGIIDEYLRVLAYPKFSLSPEEINFIVDSLFMGNELEQGSLKLSNEKTINLKNFGASKELMPCASDRLPVVFGIMIKKTKKNF